MKIMNYHLNQSIWQMHTNYKLYKKLLQKKYAILSKYAIL